MPTPDDLASFRNEIKAVWCTDTDDELEEHLKEQVESDKFAKLWQFFNTKIGPNFSWNLVFDRNLFDDAVKRVKGRLNTEWNARPHILDEHSDNIEYACAIMSIVYLIRLEHDGVVDDMGEFIYKIIEEGLHCNPPRPRYVPRWMRNLDMNYRPR